MPGRRIKDLTALSGAGSANNDDVVIFDTNADTTKRISRSQLAEGMIGDLPFLYFHGVLTTDPTQRFNGDSLALGDGYLRSSDMIFRYYTSSGWQNYEQIAIAAATAQADRAEDEADRAEIARDDAQGVLDDRLRLDVPTLLADTTLTYTAAQPGTVVAGDVVRTREEGFAYEVAASGATDQHVTTAGGVKLYQRSIALASYNLANGASYQMGTNYGTMDQTVRASWMFDGRGGFPNKLGVNNTKPAQEPVWGVRANDTAYTPGVAEVAAVLAGYGNVCNSLAGMIASQHSMLYTGADHSSIFGGSLHTIYDNTDYAAIVGGTNCRIQERGLYAGIYNSDSCLIETGPSDAEAGFRSTIIGSASSTIGGRNGIMLGSVACTIQAAYGSIFAGETITLTSGSHMGAGGANITMGGTTAATYSFAWGNDFVVDGSRALVFGDGHRVGSGHDYTVTTGYRCQTPFIGAKVHSGRQRGNIVGNNQALDWAASQETVDTTTQRLSAAGTANFPTQPANSVVNGTVWVTGVSDAGVCSSFQIDLTSERVGTGTPTLRANTTTTIYNGLALGTVPTMNAATGGIYRVQVVGLAATNIRWDARFTGHQVVFA